MGGHLGNLVYVHLAHVNSCHVVDLEYGHLGDLVFGHFVDLERGHLGDEAVSKPMTLGAALETALGLRCSLCQVGQVETWYEET